MKNFKMKIKSFFYKLSTLFSVENYKRNILRNHFSRKTHYLKHCLTINNLETKIRIFWLQNEQMINDQLVMLKELDYYTCYFINKKFTFNSLEFKIAFDLVMVDLNWNVKKLYPNFLPNQILPIFDKLHHIFVLSVNSIKALNIQPGDTVCVMSRN